MSRIQFTGTGQLRLLTTVAHVTLAQATIAEITAGVNLTPFLRRDGISERGAEGADVDVSDATSFWDATDIGTSGAKLELTLYREDEDADDDAWNALPRGTRAYLVVAPFGFSGVAGAPAATDRIEIWKIAVSSRRNAAIAANDPQLFMVSCAVPMEPNDDAAVVA